MSKRSFGQRFRAAREEQGLTQEDTARRAQVSAKYLSLVENDHASPSIAVVTRLVEAGLGVSMSAFFAEGIPARDDTTKVAALLARQPAAVKRRVLRVVRALLDE